MPPGAFPVLLQQILTVAGLGYFALAREGAVLAEFHHRRLRELPPTGGVSVLRESIAPNAVMERAGRALVSRLAWTGPIMVEFKRDDAGTPRIMEINGRFWGSLQLAVDAGVDFPALLARAFRGESFPPPVVRVGVRTRYLSGDLESLAVVMVKGENALPAGVNNRWTYLCRFLTQCGKEELFRLNDPAPFFHDMRRYARKTASILFRRRHPRMRGIVHSHTTFSYDGKLPPNRFALHLRLRGLSFVGITEHDNTMDAPTVCDLMATCAKLSDETMTLIPGVEFATARKTHILGIGIKEYFADRDPAAIVREIKQQGGVAVLAHPDNGDFERDPEFLGNLDGVEVWNGGHDGPYVPSVRNILALLEIRKFNPKVLAFSGLDFHDAGQYRGLRLEIDETHGADAVNAALKEGRFRVRGKLFSFSPRDEFGPVALAYIRFWRAAIDLIRPIVHRFRRWRRQDEAPSPAHERSTLVLHAIETGNPGGAERVMLSIMDNLPGPRFSSRVLLRKEGWLHDQCAAREIPVDIIASGSLWDIRFALRLARLIRREGIQILHTHEFYMNAVGALAAKIAGVRHVAVVHGHLDYLSLARRRLFYRTALVLGTKIAVVSRGLQHELCGMLNLPANRILVMRNGVAIPPSSDGERTRNAREILRVGDAPTVAVIASLYPVKGHALLLDAMPRILAEIPNIKVLFIGRGDGAHEKVLREKAKPFGDSVRFLGYLSNVDEILPAVDVLAVPSLYEGLSLSLCEAMANGIPAVATRVGGNPEVIEDGANGFLIPSNDPDALAEKLGALLKDDLLRRKMGDAARATIEEKFSTRRMIEDYLDLYEDLLS